MLKHLLIITYVLSSSLKIILFKKAFSFSNIPEIASLLFSPFLSHLLFTSLYLTRAKRIPKFVEIIFGISLFIFPLSKFLMEYLYSFIDPYQLPFLFETFGLLFVILLTNLLAGRRPKIERDSFFFVFISLLLVSPKLTYLSHSYRFYFLSFIVLTIFNVSLHLLLLTSDFVCLNFVSSLTQFIYGLIHFGWLSGYYFKKVYLEILLYPFLTLFITTNTFISSLLESYLIKSVDLEAFYYLKIVILLIITLYGYVEQVIA